MDNLSDKEQVELLKKWLREYGVAITVAIIFGLGLGFGWRYWHRHKIEQAEHASMVYQQLQVAASQNQFNIARMLATQLINKYHSTPYASMAALLWARDAVLQNNLKLALAKLQWVVKNGKTVSLKQIARLRAARILLAQKKYQPALNLLKTVDDPVYQPLVDSVKGDIYGAMGKTALAKKSYKFAQSGLKAGGLVDPFLNMKISQ